VRRSVESTVLSHDRISVSPEEVRRTIYSGSTGKMKRIAVIRVYFVAVALVMAVCASTVRAREGLQIQLGAGLTVPTVPEMFADAWKHGYNIAGGVGYGLNPVVSLTANVLYSQFDFDEEEAQNVVSRYFVSMIGKGQTRILTLSGNVLISFLSERILSPYLIGGAGVSRISTDPTTFLDEWFQPIGRVGGDPVTSFSFLLGVGLDIRVAERIDMFVEGQYVISTTEKEFTHYIPVTLGVRLRV